MELVGEQLGYASLMKSAGLDYLDESNDPVILALK
jgi:hypothetical protein